MTTDTQFVSKHSHKTRLVPLMHADGLELYDISNSRRCRTGIGTERSLLTGMPETADRKKEAQLALQSFPDNADILSPSLCHCVRSFLSSLGLPQKFRDPYVTSEYFDSST